MGGSLSANEDLQKLVEEIAEALSIDVFIETGTHRGDTAMWAASRFRDVYTIEKSMKGYLAMQHVAEEAGVENLVALWGDSGSLLPDLLSLVKEGPILFWLDAHDGKHRPPIREELDAIAQHPYNHVIFIDDARLFGRQGLEGWPTLEEIGCRLEDSIVMLVRDAIVAYPPQYEQLLRPIIFSVPGATGL
ncbi:hypothetical protein LCGC14_0275310 [marine sediment metagenome]|uniref:Class I SAM-dependent methyltransferase n=1 Tax=marine sediment metagenome TaxID=412755 RepID=A0A0F9WIE0_9ZZZZ